MTGRHLLQLAATSLGRSIFAVVRVNLSFTMNAIQWATHITEAPISEDGEQGVDVALTGEVQACPHMAVRTGDTFRVPVLRHTSTQQSAQ